jgi:hypothetical protein
MTKYIFKIVFSIVCFCITSTAFSQEFSDKEIGLDVAKSSQRLKEQGKQGKVIEQEINLLRNFYRNVFLDLERTKNKTTSNIAIRAVNDIPQSEKNVLQQLYNNTGGVNWNNTTGWDFNTPVTSWNGTSGWWGVTVENGHIVSLNQAWLTGNIPDLSGLSYLRNLSLLFSQNYTGNFVGLQNLTSLVTLNLNKNFVNSNQLSILPICNLVNLEYLYVNGFKTDELLPQSFYSLIKLKELSLSGCTFSGDFSQISNLVNLEELYLSNIDSQFGTFYRYSNTSIPQSFQNLIKLKKIYFGSIALSQNLSVLGTLTNLKNIGFWNTNFSGPLPQNFSNLLNLEALAFENFNISSNQISDISSITNLTNLRVLSFPRNNLTSIPNGFQNLVNIKNIDFGDNKIGGTLPSYFSNFAMTFLNISNNNFEGTIPVINIKNSNAPYISTIASGPVFTQRARLFGIANNKFRFNDFINDFATYKNNIATFIYQNQQKTDSPITETKAIGQSITMTMCEDNRFNSGDTFQWFKNGIAMSGATSRQYTISALASTDGGVYTCKSYHTTNPDMSPLVLEREPITLIVSAAPCLPPSDLSVTSFSGTTATISWVPANGVTNFEVFASPVGSGTPTVAGTLTTQSTYTFINLLPNTAYNFYVRTNCGNKLTSSWNMINANPSSNCAAEVHFNFNFKLPALSEGGLLNFPERESVANGIINFVNSNLGQNLYLTTYDDFSGGGVRTLANQSLYTTQIPPATTNGANETQGLGLLRFQNDFYGEAFKNIIQSGLMVNPVLTKKIDVAFFVFAEDKFANIADLTTAYNLLLTKANKIFFVIVDEGKFRNTTTNTLISPIDFITQVKGSTPINYSNTNSILNSDYISYSKIQIATTAFQNSFKAFLQNAYNEVKQSKCIRCTDNNPKTLIVKQLFVNLLNHLRQRVISGLPVPDGYDCPELVALRPYLTDAGDRGQVMPKIYYFSPTNFAFSFHQEDLLTKRTYDVRLGSTTFSSPNITIASIGLDNYDNSSDYTKLSGNIADILTTVNIVRHIDFCPEERCVNHVAIVVDESGSLTYFEKQKIKRQLKSFVIRQAQANEDTGGNMYISLIGLSDSDVDTRKYLFPLDPTNTDAEGHIYAKITNANLNTLFLPWIDKFGNRYGKTGVSEGSDYWKSGLDLALASAIKPDMVILITDGLQTNKFSELKTVTMAKFNNYGHPIFNPDTPYQLLKKPHLYVIGIENGFYVDSEQSSTLRQSLPRNEDPNFVPTLRSSSENLTDASKVSAVSATETSRVTSALKLSLKALLNLANSIFPTYNDPAIFKYDDYIGLNNFELLGDDDLSFISDNIFYAGISCGKEETNDSCDDCFSFQPEPDKTYVLNAWAKEELNVQVQTYSSPKIKLVFRDSNKQIISTLIPNEFLFEAKGDIIEGWQRIGNKFKVPSNAFYMEVELVNSSSNFPVYFDDIRVYPVKGSMKSFVYDPETFRLMSELDENNYATYYEYDNEGGLVRIKKETAQGVKTIQETRSGNFIIKE